MANLWEELNEKVPIYYKDIIDKYSLICIKLNSIETIFIRENNYGLRISIDKFNVNVSYVMRDENGKLIQLNCNNFLSERFDQRDRENIVVGESAKESIINDFIITNRGLQSKFHTLLQGDKSWINDLKKSVWFDGEKKLSESEMEKISLIL